MAEKINDGGPALDAATIQWCVNELDALIAKRISMRHRNRRTHDDEIIAASARYLVERFAATRSSNMRAEG